PVRSGTGRSPRGRAGSGRGERSRARPRANRDRRSRRPRSRAARDVAGAAARAAAAAPTWPPHSPSGGQPFMSVVLLPAVYFCKALQLRGPRHGPRTPPVADNRSCRLFCFLRFTSVRLFSCGGLEMAPALPQWRTSVGGWPFGPVVSGQPVLVGRLAFLAFQEQGDDLGGDRAGPGVEFGLGQVGDRVRH